MNNNFKYICLFAFIVFALIFIKLEYFPKAEKETFIEKDYINAGKEVMVKDTKGYILFESGSMVAIRYQNTNGDWRKCNFYKWELSDPIEIEEQYKLINSIK